jgi:hypothetical protein
VRAKSRRDDGGIGGGDDRVERELAVSSRSEARTTTSTRVLEDNPIDSTSEGR